MTASPFSDRPWGASTTGLSMTWVLTAEGLQFHWKCETPSDESPNLELITTHPEQRLAA